MPTLKPEPQAPGSGSAGRGKRSPAAQLGLACLEGERKQLSAYTEREESAVRRPKFEVYRIKINPIKCSSSLIRKYLKKQTYRLLSQ